MQHGAAVVGRHVHTSSTRISPDQFSYICWYNAIPAGNPAGRGIPAAVGVGAHPDATIGTHPAAANPTAVRMSRTRRGWGRRTVPPRPTTGTHPQPAASTTRLRPNRLAS